MRLFRSSPISMKPIRMANSPRKMRIAAAEKVMKSPLCRASQKSKANSTVKEFNIFSAHLRNLKKGKLEFAIPRGRAIIFGRGLLR